MVCHQCGKPVEVGQRFCGACGASLSGVTDATEVVVAIDEPVATGAPATTTVDPTEEWVADDPVWAATGAVPITDPLRTSDLPATQAIAAAPVIPVAATAWPLADTPDADDVWALAGEGVAVAPPTGVTATAEMPSTAAPVVVRSARSRLRFGAVSVFGLLTAVTGLAGAFTVAVSVETDTRLVPTDAMPPTFRTGTWYLDDFGDNLSVAILIAAILTVVGGVAAMFRWRWGSGLAGGAGLAMAGMAALAAGLAQMPIEAAREFAAIPNPQEFTLTITRDVGYWLLIVAGGLGIIVFFASLNDAFGDRRPGLNPWFAALGALATVVAVIGPMLPEGTAIFSDNWYVIDEPGQPPALLVGGRLVQLALLLVGGVIGYLCVRRWGLGLAIGGAAPFVWLAISTLFDLTDTPVGPAYRNPGAVDDDLHGVTIIGVSAMIAMAILALVAAYDQTSRERR